MKLFVGNLSKEVTADQLLKVFEEHGWVDSVEIIKESESGISMGIGFVVMSTYTDGQKAMDGLNGKEIFGQTIDVSEDRRDRSDRREFVERRDGIPRRKLADRRRDPERRLPEDRRQG